MRRISSWFCVVAVLLAVTGKAAAMPVFSWGGSIRVYQFLRLQQILLGERRDSEFFAFRLTPVWKLNSHFGVESHLLLEGTSPSLAGPASIASGSTWTLFPLDSDWVNRPDFQLRGSFDRLNLKVDYDRFQMALGRQAISWGVAYFWPALDLFAPFSPERIDRDYKPGVDAIRTVIPIGTYSEVQVVGASLGSSLSRDGALAALGRVNLGRVDLGWMGGRFHRDNVAGGFISASLWGSAFRGEIAWTGSGDPADRLRRRPSFWRGSVGFDRQLSPAISVTGEFAWNGYGRASTQEYALVLASDRFLRGEINGLGRAYTGGSLSWQIHPLWLLQGTALVNWNDGSSLFIPAAHWSTGNNSEVLFGAYAGVGERPDPSGVPLSEYGSVPFTLFGAFRFYF